MIEFKEILAVLIRAVVAILLLITTTKILGKKQLSQLTIYDYVIGITIGSIAADIILNVNEQFIIGIVAILIFCTIGFMLSLLSIKCDIINKLLNGNSTILMENGEFNLKNLRKTRITIYKFIEQARLNGYYNLEVLNYAILETNGQISFLLKENFQSNTKSDFKTTPNKDMKQYFCKELIIDGKIIYKNLEYFGKSEKWLKEELDKRQILSYKNVLLLTIDETKKVQVYLALK